jgi:hypothetical protein
VGVGVVNQHAFWLAIRLGMAVIMGVGGLLCTGGGVASLDVDRHWKLLAVGIGLDIATVLLVATIAGTEVPA